jgi:hypothetical protein
LDGLEVPNSISVSGTTVRAVQASFLPKFCCIVNSTIGRPAEGATAEVELNPFDVIVPVFGSESPLKPVRSVHPASLHQMPE